MLEEKSHHYTNKQLLVTCDFDINSIAADSYSCIFFGKSRLTCTLRLVQLHSKN